MNWLGCQGSNLGMTESKSVALPLGYTPTVHPARLKQAGMGLYSSARGLVASGKIRGFNA